MELMSPAFLCILVVLLPQTLVKARNKNSATDFKYVNSLEIGRNFTRKSLLLNTNGPPLVSNFSAIQSVFNDIACKSCIVCMDRAIRAHSMYDHKSSSRPSAEELREDVLTDVIIKRTKRKAVAIPEGGNAKKSKAKKKQHKSVTVTKYEVDSEVYAIKVKETPSNEQQSDKMVATCHVYSVKKSFPCGSAEGEALLLAAKRRADRKKSKKEQDKKTVTSTMATAHISMFKKREADDSQVPDNIMPSVEDIY